MNSTPLLNEKEAAQYLRVSVSLLQQRRFKSQLPRYIRIGRAVRYHQSDLEDYVKSCRITPGEAA